MDLDLLHSDQAAASMGKQPLNIITCKLPARRHARAYSLKAQGYMHSVVAKAKATVRLSSFHVFMYGLLRQLAPTTLDQLPNIQEYRFFKRAFLKVPPSKHVQMRQALHTLSQHVDIHLHYLSEADSDEEMESEIANDAIALRNVRRSLRPSKTSTQTLAAALAKLRTIGEKQCFRACGDISTEPALRFCFEARTPKELPTIRRALLLATGFRFAEELDHGWECVASLHDDFRNFDARVWLSFDHYQAAAQTLGASPRAACAQCTASELQQKLEHAGGKLIPDRTLFTIVSRELQSLGKSDVLEELRQRVHPALSGLSKFDWISRQSLWHTEFCAELVGMFATQYHQGTHFPKTSDEWRKKVTGGLFFFLQDFVHDHYSQEHPEMIRKEDCLKWFLCNCTMQMATTALRAWLGQMTQRNEIVKSLEVKHHAQNAACHSVSLLKVAVALAQRKDVDDVLAELKPKQLLRQIPNRRIEADGRTRRTFTTEEIELMYEQVQDDARLSLIFKLLREIGLRITCLCNLRLTMLVDAHFAPRHTCRVPEKAKTWRCFVTSVPLKQAIARYVESIRDKLPQDGSDPCLLNPRNFAAPLPCECVRVMVKRVAQDAGVTDVVVHPHAFRHTIVGHLIDAGNSMDLVSKFMGHANINTTAKNYWVPETLELHEKMNNPFTGSFQSELAETTQLKKELELVYGKFTALTKLHHQLRALLRVSASNGMSAVDMEKRYREMMPNEEALLQAILESTSSSISGLQAAAPEVGAGRSTDVDIALQ